MAMIRYTDEPGTPAWHARRASCFNAGDASAMLGCHPSGYTRTQLLQDLHTGIEREFSDFVQERVIDPGHRVEALWRPIAEEIVGEDLQVLAGSLDVGLSRPLGASLDGITFLEDTLGECKSANEALRAALPHTGRDSHERNDARQLPKGYRVQLEQQQLAFGATRTLFSACQFNADGSVAEERHCWYTSDPALRAEILAGWRQFDIDLAAYVPPAAAEPAPTGRAPDSLPALRIELMGQVTASNLAEFKATALGAIRSVNRELSSDQHFADAKQAVKWCGEVESRIKAAKEHALSQTATIEQLFRTLDDVSAEARSVRLDLEKLVTRREHEIKGELVAAAKAAYEQHEAACRQDAGAWKMLTPPDFGSAIKGKRSVDSMRDALNACLANAKIAASEQARKIRANLSALDEESKGSEHLFRDRLTFIDLTPEAVRLMVRQRIAEHRAAEERRAAELAERERERIRAEEAARLQREADEAQARLRREQEERRAAGELEYGEALEAAAAGKALECRRFPHDQWQPRRSSEEMNAHSYYRLAPAQAPTAPAPTQPPAADPIASPAVSSQAGNVLPMQRPTPAPATPPTLTLGQIGKRLGFNLTADFLKSLGFEPAGRERAAVLFHEANWPGMCQALVAHVSKVSGQQKAA